MSGAVRSKVCLVTGTTSGIGEATARALAQAGAAVVGVGRDPQKCAEVSAHIREATNNPTVEFLVADLSSQAQVRRLAEQFKSRHARLDVLVNNAGGFFNTRRETVDGIEMTFALNHLAPFLLSNLLFDWLKASAPARVVNVSSDMQKSARIDFDDLEGRQHYSGWRAYGQSKLANILFTYELARRLQGTGVTANVLHPGFVATNIGRNYGLVVRLLYGFIQKIVARPPEEGAKTSVYLATSPEVEAVTGKYFIDQQAVDSSPVSYDEAAARRLWQLSEQMTAL